MRLTLSSRWFSHSLNAAEFSLFPTDNPDDRVFLWEDMVIVKSSGSGHGMTILTDVGTTPKAVIASLTSNPDFLVVSPPTPVTTINGFKATRVVVAVSDTARYDDSSCPFNPRCADLFARRDNLSEYFSIGGPEEVRIDIAAFMVDGSRHTLFIALDAPAGHTELERLAALAQPVIDSVRLPPGAVAG